MQHKDLLSLYPMPTVSTSSEESVSVESSDPLIVCFGGDAPAVIANKDLHGGKGASLITMTSLGLRVPPGFILTTAAYRLHSKEPNHFKDEIWNDVQKSIEHIERTLGKKFGEGGDPLLVSVRSGAPVSMPGMMDTILNLGLCSNNIELVALEQGEFFAWSSYLRLISQITKLTVDLDIKVDAELIDILDMSKAPIGNKAKERCIKSLALLAKRGSPFPQDPWQQLRSAIRAVFSSWNNERAKVYRKLQNIPETLGTACSVQAMIFGNRNEKSGTGVCFSRDPSTGKPGLVGEYLVMGQGEDVVAGIRTPAPLEAIKADTNDLKEKSLDVVLPDRFEELKKTVAMLEEKLHDILDIEFTIENGTLYFLQCRSAKRSAKSALKSALDFLGDQRITQEEALKRIEPQHIASMLQPSFDKEAVERAHVEGDFLARGLPAGPGAAIGKICFDEADAPNESWILVRHETCPDDVPSMVNASGVLTVHGGMSSHAALVARQLGIVCIVGCEDLQISGGSLTIDGQTLNEGDVISINGSTGEVFRGSLPMEKSTQSTDLIDRILDVSDGHRRLAVRANADTGEQAEVARKFGAKGIGLARTEHMFFGNRLPLIQKLIIAKNGDKRVEALEELKKLQQKDFYDLLKEMNGLPVTIRTIDPPLHEFLPKKEHAMALAENLGVYVDEVIERIEELAESNPMLGLRGCRVGILYPEIPLMQIEALASAAKMLKDEGMDPMPEIMIPLTSCREELLNHRKKLEKAIKKITDISIPIGTMVEVPRAALTASEIAEAADFLSFGTNDLTQLTLAISRDDASLFLPTYLEKGIYPHDPFASLDRSGVGKLMKMAISEAREVKPDIKIGICGEHGGDPDSIEFCESLGLDYVSCSPYRVPVARLAGAHASMRVTV